MIDIADTWDVVRREELTARKPWRCIECGRTIQPGERYHYTTGRLVTEKQWQQIRQCQHCHTAADWLLAICSGWIYGEVYNDLREHWDEYPSRALARLTVGIKTRWHDGRDPVPTWADQSAREALQRQRESVLGGLRSVTP